MQKFTYTFAGMLNELNNLLNESYVDHVDTKRRLITFNLQIRRAPRPNQKWSLNSSLQPHYLNKLSPQREKDLTVI